MPTDIEARPAPGGRRQSLHRHAGCVGRQGRCSGIELVGQAATHDVDGLPAASVGKALAGKIGDDRRRLFDRAEIVVQIFDTPDPACGAKTEFSAGAGNPAEMISRRHTDDSLADWRHDDSVGLGAVEALPGKARRAVEQDIRIGERNGAADAGPHRAEIFHVVAYDVRGCDASAEILDKRRTLAANPRCAAVHFEARDPAAILPVVAGLSACDPASGIDIAERSEWG